MADRAITLDVTADAGADISLCLPSVMTRRTRAVGPLRLRWMEAPALDRVGEWARHADPEPLVAAQAKRLVAMAARALLLIFARSDGMHAEPIIGVNAARSNPAVVAISTVFLAVAIGAKA